MLAPFLNEPLDTNGETIFDRIYSSGFHSLEPLNVTKTKSLNKISHKITTM